MVFFKKARTRDTASGGIQDRIDLLRALAARDSRRSYLEIGCNRNKVFKQIPIEDKLGVDPNRGGTHRMTSDEFFAGNERKFDLVFIDGLHRADQVMRDIDNTLKVLTEKGVVVLHDCNPATEEAQIVPPARRGVPWNGDVWKAVVVLRSRPEIDIAVADFDYGCGVLLPRANTRPLESAQTIEELTYADLEANRQDWLRLMSGEQILEFVDGA